MTAHQSTGVAVIRRQVTQDGYDWPTPHPQAPQQPMAAYFRAQMRVPCKPRTARTVAAE